MANITDKKYDLGEENVACHQVVSNNGTTSPPHYILGSVEFCQSSKKKNPSKLNHSFIYSSFSEPYLKISSSQRSKLRTKFATPGHRPQFESKDLGLQLGKIKH